MRRAILVAAGAGAAFGLVVAILFVVPAADEGVEAALGSALGFAGALGLFLAPVVLQVRQAMSALRRLESPVRPVAAVSAAYVLAASAVLIPGALVDDGGPDDAVLLLWWWPVALGALLVIAGTEVARRRVRRWAASRRSPGGGGNGSA